MLTPEELQQFEERKQGLENILNFFKAIPPGGTYPYKPGALWLETAPAGISADRFEELKKLAWLRYTSAKFDDEFHPYMGQKNSLDHLLFQRLLTELNELGNAAFIKKTVTENNTRGIHSAETKLEKTKEDRETYRELCREWLANHPEKIELDKTDTKIINADFFTKIGQPKTFYSRNTLLGWRKNL